MSSSKYSWLQMPWTAWHVTVRVDHEDLVGAVHPGHLHRALGDLVDAEQVDPSHAAAVSRGGVAPGRDPGIPLRLEQLAQAVLGVGERDAGDDRLEEAEDDELARLVGRDAAALEVEELGLVDRARPSSSAPRGGSRAGRSRGSGWRRSGPPSRGSSRTRRGSCPSRPRLRSMTIMPFMYARAASSSAPFDSRLPVVSRPMWRV